MQFSNTIVTVYIICMYYSKYVLIQIVNVSNSLFPFAFPEHTGLIFSLYVPEDRFLKCSGEVPEMF